MLDLSKKILPSAVLVDGNYFKIKTDFSYWIDFKKKLEKTKTLFEFDYLYIDKIPDRQKGFQELLKFAFPKNELPRPVPGDNSHVITHDFELDADLIYAAFMEQYHIDLLETRLHWFKFLALFDNLHDTKFNDVVGYRCFNPNLKYDDKAERSKMKRMWEIGTEFTAEEEKAIEEFDRKNGIKN